MTKIDKIKYKIDRYFYLEAYQDKTKTIEILLIVASLMAVFNFQSNFKIVYIFFIISSIPYFIMIQKGKSQENISKDYKQYVNLFSWITAISFSSLLSVILTINAVNNLNDDIIKMVSFIVIYTSYTIFLTLIIWTALKVK